MQFTEFKKRKIDLCPFHAVFQEDKKEQDFFEQLTFIPKQPIKAKKERVVSYRISRNHCHMGLIRAVSSDKTAAPDTANTERRTLQDELNS
ncbi:hypothetical protein CDAR_25541 [Caerostris darwini]|uniref:Uncharacterized protein n=1 Tax=Caerostris darwini TaxID=1538125 RepID=A0AAV4TZP3_9ARAC|nr:hypothetical protein CDAR_25541 [Caerostris darwini]